MDRFREWIEWRDIFELDNSLSKIPKDYKFPEPYTRYMSLVGSDICPICNGWEELKSGSGTIPCVCGILKWQDTIVEETAYYRSPYDKQLDWETVSSRPNDINNNMLIRAKEVCKNFVDDPSKWILMSGGVGTGKTSLMKIMASYFAPVGTFIKMNLFENKVFDLLSRRDEGISLSDMIHKLSIAPILFIDDFGAEYSSNIVMQKITSVIDYRYEQYDRLPTVVSTNLDPRALLMIPRIGSRLLDRDKTVFLPIALQDYRTRSK